MQTRTLDQFATALAEPQHRRQALRLFGAAVLGAGGVGLLASESEARRRRRRKKTKKQKQNTPPAPDPVVDIAITAILVEPTAETLHDNLVVQFVNNGTLTATEFRIGMSALRTNGQIRNVVYSEPTTLAPGESGSAEFRLGCAWINGGTVTARTDPSPVPNEPGDVTGDNTMSVTFAADICS